MPGPSNVVRRLTPYDVHYVAVPPQLFLDGDYYGAGPDSDPQLEAISGTDAYRLAWDAGNVSAIQTQFMLPKDLAAQGIRSVHVRAAMSGATDTPALTVQGSFDEGGDSAEAYVAEVEDDVYRDYEAVFTEADVPKECSVLHLKITPAAHATDALYVTGVMVEIYRDRQPTLGG